MMRVVLVNLPFADVRLPSIALTQLKCVLERTHGERLVVSVLNLNHDFAVQFGEELYRQIAYDSRHHTSGLGDWIFRQVAFPDEMDNSDAYFARYYGGRSRSFVDFRKIIIEKREFISEFFIKAIEMYNVLGADVVGLTTMFSQTTACCGFARTLKSFSPQTTIVIGGANCEYPMGGEIIANVKAVDFVFSGPSLISFPQFIGRKLDMDDEALYEIDGVLSRGNQTIDSCGELSKSVEARGMYQIKSIGEELDINVPIPLDYSDFLDSFEKHFPNSKCGPALTFETSRGCWWGAKSHCTFCGLNGLSMNYRAMQPVLAIEQFRTLFKYSPRCSDFRCVDNILPKNYVKEVFPFIKCPEGASVFYEVKADLSASDVQVLSQARVNSIQPGIEALSTSTLKLMRKGTNAFQNIRLLKICVQHGVSPEWNLLVGFPGESESTYEKYVADIPRLVHLHPPSGSFPVRFDRFSPYFDQSTAFQLKLKPFDFYSMTYPFSNESLSKLAFYFVDTNSEAEYYIGMLNWIEELRVEVDRWKVRWIGGFDCRPRLEFRKNANCDTVFDSRQEPSRMCSLTPNAATLLRHLETPSPVERLYATFRHLPKSLVDSDIAMLRESDLLYEEEGRLMSLVIETNGDRIGGLPFGAVPSNVSDIPIA